MRFPDGRRLLGVSRRVKERVRDLCLVYLIEQDRKYADRAWEEAAAACAFPDWNPSHFLDTAEMTYAVATAYDWLHHLLSADQRETLENAIIELGLKPGLEVYAQEGGWHTRFNNWNQVCNGGLGLGALAIADRHPEIAAEILQNAIDHIPLAMTHYAPDGAGTEGVTYWDYGSRYNCLFLSGLQTALGKDFGLADLDGFKESGDYQIYFAGADRQSFDFGDCGLRRMSTPMHFWLARRFGIHRYSWFRWSGLQDPDRNGNALDILWYDDSGRAFDVEDLPLDRHFRQAECVSMRSDWTDHAIIVAFQAGQNRNLGAHRHLDLGSFILDARGQRWIHDSGTERITYQRHKHGNERWAYYRLRAEGHNTLVMNPERGPDQLLDAQAKIIQFDADANSVSATADLSAAYAPHAERVVRSIAMPDRSSVVVTDELELANPVDLYWFAHTKADIVVDGKTATLEQNGQSLIVTIEEPATAVFTVAEATPFPTSPDPGEQSPNDHLKKLVIHLPRAETGRIQVTLKP